MENPKLPQPFFDIVSEEAGNYQRNWSPTEKLAANNGFKDGGQFGFNLNAEELERQKAINKQSVKDLLEKDAEILKLQADITALKKELKKADDLVAFQQERNEFYPYNLK